jgi:TRAP transporter 4TM/12TM fusion protein
MNIKEKRERKEMGDEKPESKIQYLVERYRGFGKVWGLIFVVITALGVVFSLNEIFLLGLVYHEFVYYYGLLAIFLSSSFLIFPISKVAPKDRVPWYDILLFLLSIACCAYFMFNAERIANEGWVTAGPTSSTIVSIFMWGLVLEALRRAGGLSLFAFTLFFSLFPLFADHMPGFLEGTGWSLSEAGRFYAMTHESIIGIPTRVFCDLVIGFMVFGSALNATGGGSFFIKFAFAIFGGVRGGPAKVSVVASSLFGTISGSAVSNVVVTGCVTIPTMKRAGYEAKYAAAVEACASSGGCIMPPVMGAVAFIMASFLNIPYSEVCLTAIVPALLYYWGLFVQIDGHAAQKRLLKIPKTELPTLKETIKGGWIYLFSIITLIYLLFYLRREAQAPYIATVVLLIGTMFKKETRLNWNRLYDLILDSGKILSDMVAILAGIGLIMGGFSMTGVAISFASQLVHIVGGNNFLLLLMGAVISYILGMGMTVSACYIFLAMILVPALIPSGFNVIALHFFVLYCGIWSFITPPVALASYVAAVIGGADFWKTGLQSMRLGFVKYLIPFFFVYDPSLVFQGSDPYFLIFIKIMKSFLAVWILGSSIEGYLLVVGKLGIMKRAIYFIAGILLFCPGWMTDIIGFLMFVIMFLLDLLKLIYRKRISTI